MGIIVSENIYQHLADWEKNRGGDGKKVRLGDEDTNSDFPTPSLPHSLSRSEVIHEATIEVAPAVLTAVATTIVSFLPVFFLTGRDYRLFSPLAYTKTFAIAAAMLTAVTMVPALSRIMLRSANYRKRTALVAGLSFAGLMSAASHFLWGSRFADLLTIPHWLVTVIAVHSDLWSDGSYCENGFARSRKYPPVV